MSATDLLGETLNRKYKLLSFLGEGGMGAVYEAEPCVATLFVGAAKADQ